MAAAATMAGSGAAVANARAAVAAVSTVATTGAMAAQQATVASAASAGASAARTTITNHAATPVATVTRNSLALTTDQSQSNDREKDRNPEQNETIHVSPPQNSLQVSQKNVAEIIFR